MIKGLIMLLIGSQVLPPEAVQEDPDALGYWCGERPTYDGPLPAIPDTADALLAVIDGA
jgi:hypothetical protein